MSANEFAYIMNECELSATVIVSSIEIKEKFIGIPNVQFIELYDSYKDRAIIKGNSDRTGKGKKKFSYIPKVFLIPLRIISFYKKIRFFKKVISPSCSVAIIATDRSYADGFVMVFYYFCKKNNIKMIIPSTAIFSTKESMLKMREKKEKEFLPSLSEKIFFHKYIEKIEGKELIYYPIDILCTFKFFGVLSKNPWVMGANNSAILCLNNEELASIYCSEGVKKANIEVLGSYKLKSSSFNEKENVDVIGISLPQMYEHNILPWDEHIEIIEKMLCGLQLLDKKLVVFLHPKMKKSTYKYLESKFNCTISSERTDVALVDTDLYIATYSTTVFTATIYGIPSLVLDCFNANYNLFDKYTSIEVFSNIELLLEKAKMLCINSKLLQQAQKKTRFDSKRLEVSPGIGMKNLKKLIESEM